jgi:hypothetical protein
MPKVIDKDGNIISGRKKGYKVTEETKAKTRASNPSRNLIESPFGTFDSRDACSKATGISRTMIGYYCNMGARQRNNEPEAFINKLNGKMLPDYTAWKSDHHPRECVAVQTPLGVFPSMLCAANAHNVTTSYISQKVKQGIDYRKVTL